MIDPMQSLTSSIHSSRGVYALLLGSGVSRAANIPTGWEVTLDLISRLAAILGEDNVSDPVQWYRDRFAREPDYSRLLKELAKAPTERQQLLRGYFEPSTNSTDNSDKQPTEAHRAIATLVAAGYFRVIITTNFDRLFETALLDENIAPTVLASSDHIRGAMPLIHTSCCVLKLHGDYHDSRILNTDEELASYPEEQNQLLDRILDEFGLIICGWSGDWDEALRSAILRTTSRRFTTYWAKHGELTDTSQDLIAHRDAQVISIDTADAFFSDLREQLLAIDRFSQPDSDSTAIAVARLKEYLPEPKHRIRLSDLVDETVERLIERLSDGSFSADQPREITSESATYRMRAYEAAVARLLHLACVGGRWAEEAHYAVWRRALQRLDSHRAQGGMVFWLEMQRYPQTLLLYALGLGALRGGALHFLNYILSTPLRGQNDKDHPAVQILPPLRLFSSGDRPMRILEGMERKKYPLNDWIHDSLQPIASQVIPDPVQFEFAFDKLEVLIALAFAHRGEPFVTGWMPVGAFQYRYSNRHRVLQEIRDSIANSGNSSEFVKSGIFADTAAECEERLQSLEELLSRFPPY